MLLKTGRLEHLKEGPVYWMDSADTNPRIGEHKLVSHGKVKMDALTQMTERMEQRDQRILSNLLVTCL